MYNVCVYIYGIMLETSAFESLYGGQFTLSTQLIKPNYLVYIYVLFVDLQGLSEILSRL